MIKTVVSTMAMAMVAANEDASMLLQSVSQGQRIRAAVAEHGTGKDSLDDILIDDDTRDGKKGKGKKPDDDTRDGKKGKGKKPKGKGKKSRKGGKNGECELFGVGTPALGTEEFVSPSNKKTYHKYLKGLDVKKLYDTIVGVMKNSQKCWPADGPQDNDVESYAGLFGRLAWHCSGTLRIINDKATGGCEGGRVRHWPEKEWRDNANLDQARAILAVVKSMPEYQKLSWGDLMTFAGTVGIKASGGPAHKFCFGRIDDSDGKNSIMLGTDGITQCELGAECVSNSPCETNFQWPEQDPSDHSLCNVTQADGRFQGSHAVGLIYVYPEGPQLRQELPEFDSTQTHQRSQRLSALEVRDTFTNRMGWTNQETVALIGGGHTLGRNHGNCADKGKSNKRCTGKYTSTSGFEGAWTRTPSQWNYDYFDAMLHEEWVATKSPDGADQWGTKDSKSPYAATVRLTADLSLITDPVYKKWAVKYQKDHKLFDKAFAEAWFKLTHRSQNHPLDDDLENDAKKCTNFDF